jgi:hypothetical protein
MTLKASQGVSLYAFCEVQNERALRNRVNYLKFRNITLLAEGGVIEIKGMRSETGNLVKQLLLQIKYKGNETAL